MLKAGQQFGCQHLGIINTGNKRVNRIDWLLLNFNERRLDRLFVFASDQDFLSDCPKVIRLDGFGKLERDRRTTCEVDVQQPRASHEDCANSDQDQSN